MHFIHFIPYSLGCGASCDSSDILGLKAQVYVVCDQPKLMGVQFEKEPNVPLLVVASVPVQSTSMLKPMSMSAKSQTLLRDSDCCTGFGCRNSRSTAIAGRRQHSS